jgi:hypothetical protein
MFQPGRNGRSIENMLGLALTEEILGPPINLKVGKP